MNRSLLILKLAITYPAECKPLFQNALHVIIYAYVYRKALLV
jgi:hypothetical protein